MHRGKGWHHESSRHALAARGIKSKVNDTRYKIGKPFREHLLYPTMPGNAYIITPDLVHRFKNDPIFRQNMAEEAWEILERNDWDKDSAVEEIDEDLRKLEKMKSDQSKKLRRIGFFIQGYIIPRSREQIEEWIRPTHRERISEWVR